MKEEWKGVPNYEGYYAISTHGRVKSIERSVIRKNNKKPIVIPERILKQTLGNSGYYMVGLSKNGKLKYHLVHRLVAEAFIPNPNNYPCVNHKSMVKTENSVDNLEWCSVSYNNTYGHHSEVVGLKLRNRNDTSKTVKQYDRNGLFIKEWPSAKEVQRCLNIHQSNISECCRGIRKTAGGYLWTF